ncbi:MAG TPA: helix-turn-helix domain-containing protein [Arthrobacter sp.]|nr:helix-turn-helix domain-containing protein [Arthrobacter sp.]
MANSASGDSVVDRIVRLISAFPEDVSALQLAELAERAGLPLTTTHRLVRQLAGHGLLEAAPGGLVRPGLRLWELVNRTAPTLALRQAAMPFMEDIQQVLNQNVNLAVLDGWEALFVERQSRRGSVANRAKVAGRMPIHTSSAGLALMAHQDKLLQSRYLDQFEDPEGDRQSFCPDLPTKRAFCPAYLDKNSAEVRRQGEAPQGASSRLTAAAMAAASGCPSRLTVSRWSIRPSP